MRRGFAPFLCNMLNKGNFFGHDEVMICLEHVDNAYFDLLCWSSSWHVPRFPEYSWNQEKGHGSFSEGSNMGKCRILRLAGGAGGETNSHCTSARRCFRIGGAKHGEKVTLLLPSRWTHLCSHRITVGRTYSWCSEGKIIFFFSAPNTSRK